MAQNANYDEALKLKAESRYVESEKMLSALLKKDQNNSELWFQLGLVQRFQEKRDAALESQEKALKISPRNSDVKLEIARLSYQKGDHQRAEKMLNEILRRQPKYEEARQLLADVQKAKQAPENFKWQIDAGHQHSRFSRVKQDSWTIDFAQINRWVIPSTKLHLRGENVKRFKRHDQYAEVGVGHIFSKNLDAYFSFGRSLNADFYPRTRMAGGFEGKIIRGKKYIGDTSITFDGTYNRYPQFNIYMMKPGVRYTIVKDVTVLLQYVDIVNEYKKHLEGWSARLDWQTSYRPLRIFAGMSNAPETQNAVTIDTKSRFGGIAYDITPRLTLYLSYSRDDRENSFIRKTVDGAISFKF